MTAPEFRRAEKRQAKLRLALDGPSGSGKTWTGLVTARAIAGEGGRVAVIDTERGSASLYADRFDFDVLELNGSYDPARYIDAIRAAERAGYDVILIDSLSHAWQGEGGVMEIVDRNKKKDNSWSGWAAGTPAYRSLVDAMLMSTCHVIATMRTKVEWVVEDKKPVKIGTSPVMREGIDYEFTVVGDLDLEHVMRISKSRCSAVADRSYRHPGAEFGEELLAWLNDGEAPPTWQERMAEVLTSVDEETAAALLRGADPSILARDDAWERFQSVVAAHVAEGQGEAVGAPGGADAAPPTPTHKTSDATTHPGEVRSGPGNPPAKPESVVPPAELLVGGSSGRVGSETTTVPSESTPGVTYTVTHTPDGDRCDCPAFTFSQPPKACKHTTPLETVNAA